MAETGFTFEPGSNQKKLLNGVNRGQLGPTANEALKVLSLRLPSVLGGSPITAEDMLRPRVGGGAPMSAVGGGSSPSPLLSGAGGSGAMQVANFRNDPSTPFGGAADSDMSALAQLAQNAVSPIGAPTFTPGDTPTRMEGPGVSTQGTLPGAGDPSLDRSTPGEGSRGSGAPTLSAQQPSSQDTGRGDEPLHLFMRRLLGINMAP